MRSGGYPGTAPLTSKDSALTPRVRQSEVGLPAASLDPGVEMEVDLRDPPSEHADDSWSQPGPDPPPGNFHRIGAGPQLLGLNVVSAFGFFLSGVLGLWLLWGVFRSGRI